MLERQAETKLAPMGARSGGAGRVDVANRVPEGIRRGDGVAEVGAIIGAVGAVEALSDKLQIDALAELDVLCQAQIKLEEGIAATRIIVGDGAIRSRTVQTVEAILRASVVAGEGKEVGRVVLRNHHRVNEG